MARYRRRRLLVDPLQHRLLAVNIVYFLALILVFTLSVFLPLVLRLQSDSISPVERQEAANQFLSLHGSLWPAVGLLLALLVIHSAFISHRIAGPLFRLRKVLAGVKEGDLTLRVTLRKNDYLVREAASLTDAIEALRGRADAVKNEIERLNRLIAAMEGAAASGEERGTSLSALKQQAERLAAAAAQFRTEPSDAAPESTAAEARGEVEVPGEAHG